MEKIIIHFLTLLIQKMMFFQNQCYFPYSAFTPMPTTTMEVQQRTRFTKAEDELLRQLAESQKNPKWSEIAHQLKGRTARQCRERYNNYLRPDLINGPWTPEEDESLIRLYEMHGPKWALISRSFESRSPVNVKNRHSTLVSRTAQKSLHLQHDEKPENKPNEENVVEDTHTNNSVSECQFKNESESNFSVNDDFENMFSNFQVCDDLWSSPIVPIAEDDLISF